MHEPKRFISMKEEKKGLYEWMTECMYEWENEWIHKLPKELIIEGMKVDHLTWKLK